MQQKLRANVLPASSPVTKFWSALLITILFLLPLGSQAALQPGDIAIVGMNMGGPDEFSVLALKDIAPGETITFTDAGWNTNSGTFWPGESHHSWTVPNTGMAKGTVVSLTYPGSFANSGDQLLAYQGPLSNPVFITALNNSANGIWQTTAFSFATSALPPGLTDGVTAVAVNEAVSVRYSCVDYQGNRAEILAAIHSTENWLGNDLSPFTLGACAFVISNPAQPSMAIFVDKIAQESGNSFEIRVVSDRLGSHEAGISFAGGTATPGSDFTYNNTTRATFTNSLVYTSTIPLINDNDCENWETAKFALANATGGLASNQSAEILLQDDEGTTPLYFQGFEGSTADNWNYTPSPNPYNTENVGNGDIVYGAKAVYDVIKDFNTIYNSTSGQYFYGMAFYQSSSQHVIDFAPIDVTGLSGGELSFRYITFNLGQLEKVQYSVAYNNGSQWGNYTNLAKDNEKWERITHTIPPGVSHVRLRFLTQQATGNVCAGLDDVQLRMQGCPVAPTVATGTVPNPLCLNGPLAIQVPYSTTGSFANGNIFTALLSDASGSFANPTTIGSLAASGFQPSGNIAATLPGNLAPGSNYRIRVDANQPTTIGVPNTLPLTVGSLNLSVSSPTFPSGHEISCQGAADGSINLTVSSGTAPYSYAWTGPGGFTATTQDLSNLGPGTYSVTVSDAAGCTSNASITLAEPNLSISVAANPITCNGSQNGSATLTINGSANPFTITWSGPGGFTANTPNISGLAAGTYAVTVTDINGCIRSDAVTFTEPQQLIPNIYSPTGACGHHVSCAGVNDGSIDLTVTGGTTPYTYAWTGPGGFTANTEDLSALAPGNYVITLTDARGCNFLTNQILTGPDLLTSVRASPTVNCGYHVSCHGATDGTASLDSIAGGCPPYSILWSNGQTTANATNLGAGTHSVTITDAAGCSKTDSFILTEPDSISINAVVSPATCETANNGAIDLTIAGGCPPYTFAWTGPGGFSASSEDLANLYPGLYQFSLVDANGCTATFADSVKIYNDLSASLGCCQDTFVCAGTSMDLTVDFTGSGPWFLTWSDGTQNNTVMVLSSPYIFTVTPDSTTTYTLVSMTQDVTDCPGEVCGSATVAVNPCDSSNCDDLCVNAGVLSHFEQGNCRTVTLELACDTLCNNKTPIKTRGQCMGTQTFRFDQDPNGNPLPAGTVATTQWASLGITVTVTNNNTAHPQKGVLFDSSNPTGGDVDLGTPHQDFGGPGIGTGGAQGAPGQNDTPMGKLLVIAENDTDLNNDGLIDDPDDESAGGEMRMDFASPFYVESLTMVDLDNGNGFIRVVHHGTQITDFIIPGLGDNAVTAVPIALDSVNSVRVVLPGSGGIAALAYCPLDSQPEFVDISIPCGDLSSFSNSLNLPMELILLDPLTGISGIRVHGLPAYCQDTAGLGPFTVTYEVCNAPCAGDFCAPMLAFVRNGCVQYETAVAGPVQTVPSTNGKTPISGKGLVEVFPNPVQGLASCRLTTMYDCTGVLELYDMTGTRHALLWEGELQEGKQKTVRFDRGNLPMGIYILRLRTSNGEGYVRKFVVVD